ncbi:MAG: MmcQ/YjbR family DNA-binding protein [Planctomycetes bacterium]|nr:MmcQ/YjbR family DNA-binding protein [Planctomycetota bacterium]
MADLDRIARSLPEVDCGVACAGTSLESRTWKVGGKAFLFASRKDVRLKLDASVDEARARGFAVGKNLWVTLPLDALPPERVLAKWIAESHSAMAPKAKPKPKPKVVEKPGRKPRGG